MWYLHDVNWIDWPILRFEDCSNWSFHLVHCSFHKYAYPITFIASFLTLFIVISGNAVHESINFNYPRTRRISHSIWTCLWKFLMSLLWLMLWQVAHWILSQRWTVGDLWNMLVEYSTSRSKGETNVGFLQWLLPSINGHGTGMDLSNLA